MKQMTAARRTEVVAGQPTVRLTVMERERPRGRTGPAGPVMVPMTAEQRAQVNARLDGLLEDIRDLARRLDVVTAALPAPSA